MVKVETPVVCTYAPGVGVGVSTVVVAAILMVKVETPATCTYALVAVSSVIVIVAAILVVEVETEAICRPLRCNKPGAMFEMWLPFSALGRIRAAYSKIPMRERLIANTRRSPGTLRI
jgi:hypothetical protein